MQRQIRQKTHTANTASLAALLLTVFATELAVMELLSPLFERLSPVSGALLDAGIIVVIVALPLWVFFVRKPHGPETHAGAHPPLVQLAQVLVGIFLLEYLVMLFLPQFLPLKSGAAHFVDAVLTGGGSSVIIWRGLLRPQLTERMPLVDTPVRLYVLLLCTVFLSELVQEMVLPLMAPGDYLAPANVAKALFTTICGAPLIWLLVARPLKREAKSARAMVAAVHAQLTDAIVLLDPQAVITSFNPAAEKLFGCQAAEIIGTSAASLFMDGKVGLMEMFATLQAGAGSDAPLQHGEIKCRRRDGSLMFMNVSISVVRLEGEQPEFLLIMRDETGRKAIEQALIESENRFREIFHKSEDAIVFFEPGGGAVLDVNANTETTFGYGRDELMEGGVQLFCEPAELPALVRALSAISEQRPAQLDFLCRRRDKALIVVSMRGKVMLLRGIPVIYCTFRDVTERVRMEERTREIQAKLIQANKMTSLGLLVSGVAHEINNPNNVIMANSELLTRISRDALKLLNEYRLELGEEGEAYAAGIPFSQLEAHWMRLLEGIQDGSRRVNAIVDDLKGVARQERDQRRLVEVNQVARSAVRLMHHEVIKHTDNFRLELAQELPQVMGHSQQLGQVIINLLMNACQALADKAQGVWLVTSFDPDQGEVVITVRDEGCGMTPEEGERIMEQFFTTKLERGGTGLGLSISESIVKDHGGRLEFTSEPGRGSVFRARLPAQGGATPGTGSAT